MTAIRDCLPEYERQRDAAEARRRDRLNMLSDKLLADLDSGGDSTHFVTSHNLAHHAAGVARAEGESAAWGRMIAIANRTDLDENQRQLSVMRLMIREPDDEYSGRTNDIRRAYNDGWRSAMFDVFDMLLD